VKIIFFCLNKYQNVTHVPNCIFQGLFKNVGFRSVALVTNNPLNYCSLKLKNFTVIVSKMRVLGKKNYMGAPNAPPPLSLFRVIK